MTNSSEAEKTQVPERYFWFFGSRTSQLVGRLDRVLQSQTIEAKRGFTRDYRYSPWLCAKKSSDQINTSELLVTSSQDLEKISKLYSDDIRGTNLSAFNLQDSGFRIDSSISKSKHQSAIFHAAVSILNSDKRILGPLMSMIVQHIVPISSSRANRRKKGVGFSSAFARNAVFLSVPEEGAFSELELAVNLSHEIGHQILTVYQATDPIFISDANELVYSGVRQCLRPAILSLHAAVALAFMLEAFRLSFGLSEFQSPQANNYIEARYSELSLDLAQTLRALSQCQYTPLGTKIVFELFQIVGRGDLQSVARLSSEK